MKHYVLNLNPQPNGDYEVHETNCTWKPSSNFENLGIFIGCKDAVLEAKRNYPGKKINGCYYYSKPCHTS